MVVIGAGISGHIWKIFVCDRSVVRMDNFVHVLLQAYKLQWQRLTGEFKDVTQRYSTVQKVLNGCLW